MHESLQNTTRDLTYNQNKLKQIKTRPLKIKNTCKKNSWEKVQTQEE